MPAGPPPRRLALYCRSHRPNRPVQAPLGASTFKPNKTAMRSASLPCGTKRAVTGPGRRSFHVARNPLAAVDIVHPSPRPAALAAPLMYGVRRWRARATPVKPRRACPRSTSLALAFAPVENRRDLRYDGFGSRRPSGSVPSFSKPIGEYNFRVKHFRELAPIARTICTAS